jgi:peroxiredoxin Q/BCP
MASDGPGSVGRNAPNVRLRDHDGVEVDLDSFWRSGPAVVYFYPRDDTPGCTTEACTFRDQYEDFTDVGAQVVGISADTPEKHHKFRVKHRLPFTLLSDVDGDARRSFGVKSTFGLIPGRVTFVIDGEGVIRERFSSQFRAKAHISTSIEIIRGLAGAQ